MKQLKDPKTQKLCEVPEAVVMKVTKWVRNTDVERRAVPLPKVSPGASVLITASGVVAGTDQEKKRYQRDLINIQNNRKLILSLKTRFLGMQHYFFNFNILNWRKLISLFSLNTALKNHYV